MDNQVTIVIGPAAESLAKLSPEDPYDLVFIDADKPSNSIYFSEAKRLVRKGGVIVRLALFFTVTVTDFIRLWIMSSGMDS